MWIRRAAFVAALALAAPVWAQGPELEKKTPGIEVGKKAPKIELPDQNGKTQSLEAMLKKGKVALVFYRSGQW